MSPSRSAVGFEKRVAEAITRLGRAAAVDVAKEFFSEPTRPQISQVSVAIKRLEAKGIVQRVEKIGRKAFYSAKEVAGLAGQPSVPLVAPPDIRPIEPLRPEEPIIRPIPAGPVEPPPVEPAVLEVEIPKEEPIEEVVVEIPVKVEKAAEEPKREPAHIKPVRAARRGSMLSHPARRGHIFLARPPHRGYLTAFLALAVIVAGLGLLQFFVTTAFVPFQPPNATVLFLQPGPADGKDTFIAEKYADRNFGDKNKLVVESTLHGSKRTLIEFNLSDIPQGATIYGAELGLYLKSGKNRNLTIGAHQLLDNWVEDQVTWNERSTGVQWNAPGGDFNATPESIIVVDTEQDYKTWDVTGMVQRWVDGMPNNGIFLKAESELDNEEGEAMVPDCDGHKTFDAGSELRAEAQMRVVEGKHPPLVIGSAGGQAVFSYMNESGEQGTVNVTVSNGTVEIGANDNDWRTVANGTLILPNFTLDNCGSQQPDNFLQLGTVSNNTSYQVAVRWRYTFFQNGNARTGSWSKDEIITSCPLASGCGDSDPFNDADEEAQDLEEKNTKKKFRSSDAMDLPSERRPYLNITYTVVTGDHTPPVVALMSPTDGSSVTSGPVNFVYQVTDTSNITVCKLLLNSSVSQTASGVPKGVDQTFVQNMSAGSVSWAVSCTDAFNNTGTSPTRQLTIAQGFNFQENSTDSTGHQWVTEVIIRDSNGTIIYNSTAQGVATNIPQGSYNITIIPREAGAPIINLTFVDVTLTGAANMQVDFEQLTKDITFLDPNIIYNYLFSLDLGLNMRFDHIEYTRVAEGPNLYKCKWFDFESRQCLGQWIKIRGDLVPGEVYVQTLKTADDPAFGEGSNKFVLTNITIDGNTSDWDAILDNAVQVTTDGVSGINDLDTVGNVGRDLTKFAFTWNDTYLFLYFRRIAAPPPAIAMIAYMDMNSDGYLNSTDKVAKFRWFGGTQSYTFELATYNVSAGQTADALTGDGVPEPGNVTDQTLIEQNVQGGTADGLALEVRLNWTLLNVTPGTPFKFHISSARGDAIDLPAQVEDNMNVSNSMLSDVDISPDRSGGAKAGGWITYNHTVTNRGNIADVFDINATSNKKFNFTLSFANGTALPDSNGNGKQDVGRLGPGSNVTITVNVMVNATAPTGTVDITTVVVTATLSSAMDSVVDTTSVGNIAVYPPGFGRIANNTLITYRHTIRNNLASSPVVDVNATSSNGWATSLYYANGTALTDTDGNGRPDVGNLSAGGEVNITVKISVPDVALGTLDTTYVKVNSSVNPLADSGAVKDSTTVALRVEVDPDHADVAGIGDVVFYEHAVYNNGNISDTIDVLKQSILGWPGELFKSDKITPLPDTNGNSTPDTGLLAENGGSVKVVAKVTVPMTATEGQKDIMTITGISETNSIYRDNATDNTTAEILVIYNNSARTLKDTNFIINETVYANAFGLTVANVRFVWVDGNGTNVRTSPSIGVDISGQALDEFTTNISHAVGNWTLIVTRTTGVEITRTPFTLSFMPSLVQISLVNNTVEFGQMTIGESNDTMDDRPLPFRIRNDGTVKVNITVSSTDLWSSEANPTPDYRFAANITSQGQTFNNACSLTSFTNAPSISTLFFCFLDFIDSNNEAELEVNVTVPAAEPDGNKNATVTFIASQA